MESSIERRDGGLFEYDKAKVKGEKNGRCTFQKHSSKPENLGSPVNMRSRFKRIFSGEKRRTATLGWFSSSPYFLVRNATMRH